MSITVYFPDNHKTTIKGATRVESKKSSTGSGDGTKFPGIVPGAAVMSCLNGQQIVAEFRIEQIAGYEIAPDD